MDIKSELKKILKGKVTIVGVGNTMKGDDGFGPCLSEQIKGKIKAEVINAGTAPENYLKAIRNSKPDTIVIVDAADFGGGAGDVKLLKRDDIPLYGLSTHNASLALLFDFLKNDTKADIHMLAIQPGKVKTNASISKALAAKCNELESLFAELL